MVKKKSADSEAEVRAAAVKAFGGSGPAYPFRNDDQSAEVDVLIVADSPVPQFQTCSTITLHESPNFVGKQDIRVELVAVAASKIGWLENLVATAAFYVQRDGWPAAPGIVFEELVKEYDPSTRLPHLLWVPPYPWEGLSRVDLASGGSVYWLLAVPISESERRYIEKNGFDDFEDLMDNRRVEYFDFDRPVIV